MKLNLQNNLECNFTDEQFTLAASIIAGWSDEQRDAMLAALILVKTERQNPGQLESLIKASAKVHKELSTSQP